MEKPHYYHYATEGLKDDILFASLIEFISGVNRIALCLCRLGENHPVQVICFVLMDNHVHFILYGLEEDCNFFIEYYKQATELWLRHHGRENGPGKNWRIGHWLIPDKERLRNTIAYIHRNPTAAGMAFTPAGYRWSSASLLFADSTWILLPDGMLWPGAFVNYRLMERQFGSVQGYQFCLNKRVEEDINLRRLALRSNKSPGLSI